MDDSEITKYVNFDRQQVQSIFREREREGGREGETEKDFIESRSIH